MNIKNKSDLEKLSWYRLLKVLYILSYVLSEGYIIMVMFLVTHSMLQGESGMIEIMALVLFIGLIGIPIVFYLIQHITYYILSSKWDLK